MLILYPTLRPNSQWWGRVITSFATDEREVWLTIDDGPSDDTESILDLLDSHGARATFFVKGLLAGGAPDVIQEIRRRGHSVGNHSHTHPSGTFWALGPAAIAREIDDSETTLTNLGVITSLFRAPVGMKNPFVHPILASRKKLLIGWTVRAFDGVRFDPATAAASISRRLRPGAIVLLHEGRIGADGERSNVELLKILLDELRERGYRAILPDAASLRP